MVKDKSNPEIKSLYYITHTTIFIRFSLKVSSRINTLKITV